MIRPSLKFRYLNVEHGIEAFSDHLGFAVAYPRSAYYLCDVSPQWPGKLAVKVGVQVGEAPDMFRWRGGMVGRLAHFGHPRSV